MGNAIQKFYYGDAERKTSLGRDWHPTCLRCVQCGRVLSPGQHAEHKGNPYCHTPCYNALFGPSLLGYGSNLASPANFAKKDNAAEFGHDYDDDVYKREIYSNSRNSAAAIRRQKQRQSAPPSIIGHDFSAASQSSSSSPALGAGKKSAALSSTRSVDNLDTTQRGNSVNDLPSLAASSSPTGIDSAVDDHASNTKSSPTSAKFVARHSRSKSEQVLSAGDNQARPSSSVVRGQGGDLVPVSKAPPANSAQNGDSVSEEFPIKLTVPETGYLVPWAKRDASPASRDILEKVQSFNSHYEGKVHHQMTVEQTAGGDVKVRGPLRIYWGLSRPIQLRQCDDVPAPPISKWRHSLCSNLNEGVGPHSPSPSQKLLAQGSPNFQSPNRPLRGIDDCVLLSPSSSSDEVVMRRQKVRKFNTVAYRSDAPTKWKRASINGHIFNYDTSVFTPVLGSSTSVIVDSTMTSPVVIKTLLEKFKVENSPGEYILSVVTEKGDQTQERVLGEGDRPLLERLQLGADDHYAKMFLKERRMEPEAMVPDSVQLPIMEEEEEETLPAEVEQLMILPVAVLRGIMVKYEKDEEKEVRVLKGKYERVKRKIHQRLEELKTA